MISHYNDEYARPRGIMNFEVACNAPPDSKLRTIAQAYMGSAESGYLIAYWSSLSEFKWLSDYSMQIRDRIICNKWRVMEGNFPLPSQWGVWGRHRHFL